jgi:hypothetical protein
MVLGVPVHLAADFRHPQRDAVMLKQREPSTRTGCCRTPARTPRSRSRPTPAPDPRAAPPEQRPAGAAPRQRPGLPRVEELRYDHPDPGNQHHRLLQLPRPRRHRILPVLSRHPTVKCEPQYPACALSGTAAEFLCPRHQHIPARARSATRGARRHHGSHLPLLPRLHHRPQLPHPPAAKHHHAHATHENTRSDRTTRQQQAQSDLNAANEHVLRRSGNA